MDAEALEVPVASGRTDDVASVPLLVLLITGEPVALPPAVSLAAGPLPTAAAIRSAPRVQRLRQREKVVSERVSTCACQKIKREVRAGDTFVRLFAVPWGSACER